MWGEFALSLFHIAFGQSRPVGGNRVRQITGKGKNVCPSLSVLVKHDVPGFEVQVKWNMTDSITILRATEKYVKENFHFHGYVFNFSGISSRDVCFSRRVVTILSVVFHLEVGRIRNFL